MALWLPNRDGTGDATIDVTGLDVRDMREALESALEGRSKRRIWVQAVLFLYAEDRRKRRDLKQRYEANRFRNFGVGTRDYLVFSGKLYPWNRLGQAIQRGFGEGGMYERSTEARELRLDRTVVQLTYSPSGKPNPRF